MTLVRTAEIAVLEIGGSHVTGAWVDLAPGIVEPVGPTSRLLLDSTASAESILATLCAVGDQLEAPAGTRWAVAFPGPFDYEAGIGLFEGVAKFETLRDVDVRAALASGLGALPEDLHFVNDADAFALGVWALGTGEGRLICLTLGTGIGSAFVADGVAVRDGDTVPPDAEIHLTSWQGKPLEDFVSHRAVVRAYAAASGVTVPGVREVVERSRAGDVAATTVIRSAFEGLGEAVAPWVDRFAATDLTFGGSMAAAWDVLEPAIRAGLAAGLEGPIPRLSVVVDAERTALVGAAFAARQSG
ncbi:ROK family protein [Acidothermaceae bacterium B102]|nr:ROK family protein [Acidothermaceae bacterium B102]